MRLGRIKGDYSAAGFDSVKNAALDFIEICCNDDKAMAKFIDVKDDVKLQIARTGIDISSVGRWNHTIIKDGKIDPNSMDAHIALLDAAIDVGAKTFVCGCNYDESISLWRNYNNAIEVFGSFIDRAKGSDIKIAVENCSWNNFVHSPENWEIVLGELADLWLKYDASHAYNRHQDYLAQLSDWGERVAHVHIKGTTIAGKRSVDDPPAGMDDINWPSLFAILYARKYDGDLSIEPHSATWRGDMSDLGVNFTRDFIRRFIVK